MFFNYNPLRIDRKGRKGIIAIILLLCGCDVYKGDKLDRSFCQDCGQTETLYAKSADANDRPKIIGLEKLIWITGQEKPDANSSFDNKESTPHRDQDFDEARINETTTLPSSDAGYGKDGLTTFNSDESLDAFRQDANIDGDVDGGGYPDFDGDGDPDQTDCDPTNPEIHRSAEESCDGVDNDCDGETDDDWCYTAPAPGRRPLDDSPPPELNITLNCGVSVLHSDTGRFSNWCDQPRPPLLPVLQPDGTWRLYLMCTNFYVAEGSRLELEGNTGVQIVASGVVTIIGRRKGDIRYIDSTTTDGQPR